MRPEAAAGELAAQLGDWSSQPHGSLSRRLAGALRSRIVAGLLPAGTRLPPERQLAAALAVSRSTLVVALDELRAEGLLLSRVGSGTSVRPLGADGGGRADGRLGGDDDPERGPSLVDRVLGHTEGINLGVSAPADARHLPDLHLTTADLVAVQPSHGYEPAGLAALREVIAERYRRAGVATRAEAVHVTCGAQHGIDLALAALTRAGDRVVIEDPTYPGALDALLRRNLVPVPVPAQPAGQLAGLLARACETARPALVYLMPTVHNPSGRVLREEERTAVARAVDRPGLAILEDDTLADLAFDGRRPSSPASLAAQCRHADVVSVGSLSKVAWGGLRIGWLRAPAAVLERTVRARHDRDVATSMPSQLLALQLMGRLDELVVERRAALELRSAHFRGELARSLPDFRTSEPRGGLSVWVSLPPPTGAAPRGGATAVDSGVLAQRAARHGVGIAAGHAASLGEGAHHIRLCFDRPLEELSEGVARIAAAWAELDRRPPVVIG